MAVEDVLIKFEVDYTELDSAIAALEKTGKLDPKISESFKNTSRAISSTATDTKGLIAEFKNVSNSAIKMGKSVEDAFSSGIKDALDEAGVSVDEFGAALKNANQPTKRLKTEMIELKEQMARMKLAGKDTGAEFNALREKAGRLADAVADTGAEIKNAGSDTRHIDNVVGSISAVASGFAAAQGAIALFGDEDKDLQKTLVKVTGAMALASGIQQVYNASLKEGALAKLADSVATGVQSAAITLYTFVTGGATIATKAFRAALIATGIGAVVVLLLSLASALTASSDATKELNKSIDEENKLLEANRSLIKDKLELELAVAEQQGKSAVELQKIKIKALEAERDAVVTSGKNLFAQKLLLNTKRDLVNGIGYEIKENDKLNESIDEQVKSFRDLQQSIAVARVELKTMQNEAGKKKAEEAIKASKDAADKARALQLKLLREELAALEIKLIAVKKGGQEEINIRKDIITKKSQIEINGIKEGANQIALAEKRALDDRRTLQVEFVHKLRDDQLKALKDTNDAELEDINLTWQRKLELQVDNLEIAAEVEIRANVGKSDKIKAINAKLESDITTIRNKSVMERFKFEEDATINFRNRLISNLIKIQGDPKKSAKERIAAVYAEEAVKNAAVTRELNNIYKLRLGFEDSINYRKKLNEQKVDNERETADKIKAIELSSAEFSKRMLIERGTQLLDIASQVGNIFSQLASMQSDAESARITQERKNIEEQRAAGAISEKEAIQRQKRLEGEEKKARRRQAQREKDAATFFAILAIPRAFLKGLETSLPTAAIYAALAAVEAAIIASKPIPQFFRGKTNNYEGPGIVGDMGSEIVERGGRMFLYTKPTQTYLGAQDKVYTHSQTKAILHDGGVNNMQVRSAKTERFDYAKFGAAIPKNSININIDKDFISESVANGISRTNYMDRRYRSK